LFDEKKMNVFFVCKFLRIITLEREDEKIYKPHICIVRDIT
jgi:hypothetical protein